MNRQPNDSYDKYTLSNNELYSDSLPEKVLHVVFDDYSPSNKKVLTLFRMRGGPLPPTPDF